MVHTGFLKEDSEDLFHSKKTYKTIWQHSLFTRAFKGFGSRNTNGEETFQLEHLGNEKYPDKEKGGETMPN